MTKKSIVLLLLLNLAAINLFAGDDKNIWANYAKIPIPEDTSSMIPTDYEKAVLDMMTKNSWYLSRSVVGKCNRTEATPVYYSDSIYIARLQKLPYRIEMPYNNIVRLLINKYAQRINQVEYMVGLGESYYFPIFEQALAKYDLPMELKYLPIIESALNSKAISRAGAGGLWQFMVGTAKMYDLQVNSLVDDRFDPKKSSEAAVRYLRDLYAIYNDWHLVIAAYNCGPGNVARAIRKAGGKTGYWDIYPYLPRETRGYVPIFIAANYIMNYYGKHNICPAIPTFIKATDSVVVQKRIHLKQIAEILKIPIEELRFLNPQYKQDIVPGDIKPHSIILPMEKISYFSTNLDSILAYNANVLIDKQIVVEPAGREGGSAGRSKKHGRVSRGSGSNKHYKVKNGDTLGEIARRHGTTISKIKKANGMSSDRIRAGQTLKIPN